MKIHVLFSPNNVDELYFSGKTTVVIDVLRASTVIVTALKNNAREVIPVDSVDFAIKISGNAFSGQTLLGGERNTKMIEGFNLGNSPVEYTKEIVSGKTVIVYTSNGSKAIVKAKYSENLLVVSFNNIDAMAEHLLSLGEDTVIVCAGTGGMFCIEDSVCAGMLINKLLKKESNIEITDSAEASRILSKSFGNNILKMLQNSEHGKKLIDNGFASDLKYCAQINSSDIVPKYSSGVIKPFSEEESF